MKLLVTGAWREAPHHIAELEALGHAVVFQQQEADALVCPPGDIEGVICNALFVHHPIDQFTSLRYIQLTSAGYDRVPMDKILERGIEIHNAGNTYSIPMAEFALGGVLQLYKKFNAFHANQRMHCWEKQRELFELAGKTVCIVGCGSVGQACAKRFSAFDARVIGVATHSRPIEHFAESYGIEQLDRLLPISDIVVLALPLTEKTKYLIGTQQLQNMKRSAILVNIARGGIVDTDALARALQEGRVYGAVLDVMEEEPLPEDSVFWDLERVILTPHNSFVGEGNGMRLMKMIQENMKRVAV